MALTTITRALFTEQSNTHRKQIGTFTYNYGSVAWNRSDGFDEYDNSEGTTTLYDISVEHYDVTADEIKHALQSAFTSSPCGCSRDCCGCVSYHAKALPKYRHTNTEWVLIQNGSANY